jgi:hypothetical protein
MYIQQDVCRYSTLAHTLHHVMTCATPVNPNPALPCHAICEAAHLLLLQGQNWKHGCNHRYMPDATPRK